MRLSVILLALSAAVSAFARDIPSVELPTMGWSSWNTYRVNISDSLIMAQADALVRNGLDTLGYRFVNIDDGYFGGRDMQTGCLRIHPGRFPHGLKPVVDHIHSLGLKAGIYSDAGANTCGNYWDNDTIAKGVGLLGHETTDCDFFFKELGFDFIKVDYCGADGKQSHDIFICEPRDRYTSISEAISATGRDDVRMNVCRWNYPGTWVSDVAASWRISQDISPVWSSVKDIIAQNLYLSAYAGAGHYNDMDMLEVGRSMTPEEDMTHFAVWCMMSSPLLIGCDLTTLRPETLDLLKNPELVAVNQDPLGLQAYVAATDGTAYVLVKDIRTLNGPVRAVAFYNPSGTARHMAVDFNDIQLGGDVAVRDITMRRDLGRYNDRFEADIPAHGTRVYIMTADVRLPRSRYEAETAYLGSYQEIYDPAEVGTAYYIPDNRASGGMAAANLGLTPSNDISWRDVYVPADGDYTVTVRVLGDKESTILLCVNDEAAKVLKTCGKGNEEVSATVRLRGGRNTVRLASTGRMPLVDYIDLVPQLQANTLQDLSGRHANTPDFRFTPDKGLSPLQALGVVAVGVTRALKYGNTEPTGGPDQ